MSITFILRLNHSPLPLSNRHFFFISPEPWRIYRIQNLLKSAAKLPYNHHIITISEVAFLSKSCHGFHHFWYPWQLPCMASDLQPAASRNLLRSQDTERNIDTETNTNIWIKCLYYINVPILYITLVHGENSLKMVILYDADDADDCWWLLMVAFVIRQGLVKWQHLFFRIRNQLYCYLWL